jgi:hypothetical protein
MHNEECNDLYSSPNVIRVIKSRRMRWAGHVTHMVERGGAYRAFVLGNLKERDHMEDQGVDERIILRWIFRNWDGVIDLAQDKGRWWDLVHALISFVIHKMRGIS